MACKRTATSDLNHDNWNDEDEPEEAGTFVKAPQEVLEKRVVKSARRRLPRSGDVNTKSAFGMFSGFKTAPAASASPFSFLTKASTTERSLSAQSTNTQSSASAASNGASKIPENGTDVPSITFPSMDVTTTNQDSKKVQKNEKEDRIFKKSSDYFAKLKGLNESVTQWIKSHVDSNPFCILTPIFRDYEKYLKDIEAKHSHESFEPMNDDIALEKPLATSSKLPSITNMDKTISTTSTSTKSSTMLDTTEKNEAKQLFANISTENNPFLNKTSSSSQLNDDREKSKSSLSSGDKLFSSAYTTAGTFSFGQSSTTGSTSSAGFSFGSAKPFSFGPHVAAPQDSETKTDNEAKEDEDEPPKPDFKPITEEDAFFEKRCKVFVKKDGNFSDRGIGVLFLKSTPNGKTQLIVRADNSLGNLLLNTLLTSSIPTQRMNKNTVMLVCLPLPDSEPPPTPILLRVKTSEDADTLIETLDKNKK